MKVEKKEVSRIPIYLQIAQDLRKAIISEKYQGGDRIPSEQDIAALYSVSRMTARHAVSELVNENLVYRVHGKGVYVGHTKVERNLTKAINFYQDMFQDGLNPSTKVLKFEKRKPTMRECHELNILKMDTVYAIERIRYLNGMPFAYQVQSIPSQLTPNLQERNVKEDSFYKYLSEIGKPITSGQQKMEAVISEKVAEILGIPSSIPFFLIDRIAHYGNQVPIEQSISYVRGDKYSYKIDLIK